MGEKGKACACSIPAPLTRTAATDASSKDTVLFVSKEELEAIHANPEAEMVPAQALQPDGGIDWDCPCIKGMADGPCGDAFKSAFSCFVYSKAEPRGADCLEQFQAMQTCLLAHPEVYGKAEEGEENAGPEAGAAAKPDANGAAKDPPTENTASTTPTTTSS